MRAIVGSQRSHNSKHSLATLEQGAAASKDASKAKAKATAHRGKGKEEVDADEEPVERKGLTTLEILKCLLHC